MIPDLVEVNDVLCVEFDVVVDMGKRPIIVRDDYGGEYVARPRRIVFREGHGIDVPPMLVVSRP